MKPQRYSPTLLQKEFCEWWCGLKLWDTSCRAITYLAQVCPSPLLARRGGRDIKKMSRSLVWWSGRGGSS